MELQPESNNEKWGELRFSNSGEWKISCRTGASMGVSLTNWRDLFLACCVRGGSWLAAEARTPDTGTLEMRTFDLQGWQKGSLHSLIRSGCFALGSVRDWQDMNFIS